MVFVTNYKKGERKKHCISKLQEIVMTAVLLSGKPDLIWVSLNEHTESKHVDWPSVQAFIWIWHTITEEKHSTQKHKTEAHRWSIRREVRSRAAPGKVRFYFVLSVQHKAPVYVCITEVARFLCRYQKKLVSEKVWLFFISLWLRAKRTLTFNLTWF